MSESKRNPKVNNNQNKVKGESNKETYCFNFIRQFKA